MKFAIEILEKGVEQTEYDLQKYDRWWNEDKYSAKSDYLNSIGRGYKRLGIYTSFLGDEESRKWFGEAASYTLEELSERLNDPDYFEDSNSSTLPAIYARGINYALLSGNDEIIEKVARDALEMTERYLEFWDDKFDLFRYYNSKLMGAIILQNERQEKLLKKYIEVVENYENVSESSRKNKQIYRGFIENDSQKVYEALRDKNKPSHKAVNRKNTNPLKYIDTSLGALYALARKRGMKIELKNDRIPQVLIPEVDTSDSDMVIISGFDEIESEDDGYKVTEYFRHPGGRNIEKNDLADTEHGQYMSEDWVGGTIQDMKRDPEKNELAQNLEKALEEDRLEVELVVFQKEKEGHLIDDSLSELRIDSIDIRKGS